ncbi:glycoside hydrolase family 32 protein [Paenibacillus sp. MWE-103]|uniref:beta-fructofuranosidase n=1 Tax=Paenibacillus artemisiicola TaxID=1172618 RepID=A0ABS3WC42_9BACL|nr:glycoside hydrolase family 32 protein [Paenibacillus artemisiicola]
MHGLKPTYHFRPERNWMNDPNGPIQAGGVYHLFYQYNPNGDKWGDIHWGHAKSLDLVHWERLPMALHPSPERGEAHCFSGCAVMQDGRPALIYTSIGPERGSESGAEQWIAFGDADWTNWRKPDANPVLAGSIHGDLTIKEWRDPYVWRMDGEWYMVTGGSLGGEGCVTIYRSPDLLSWTFLNVLAKGEGKVWECPNFFRLDGKWVLTYSPQGRGIPYRTGTLADDFTFVTETEGILDYGHLDGYYAPTSFEDEQGRRIMWGWMPESGRGESAAIEGWAGVQAVPRILRLDPETGELLIRPIPELERLRGERAELGSAEPLAGERALPVSGKAIELELTAETGPDAAWGIRFFRSPNGEEECALEFDRAAGVVRLVRERMNGDAAMHRFPLEAPLPASASGRFEIRVFLDRSTVEVIVNERTALSGRVYPFREDSEGLAVYGDGAAALPVLNAYRLAPVWSEED